MKEIKHIISKHKHLFILASLLIWAIIFTKLSALVINGDKTYDLQFHQTRIVGLAQSLVNGELLPNINQIFGWGTGYASDMFYGNWGLYIPAIIFIKTQNINTAYLIFSFFIILFECLTTFYCVSRITKDVNRGFWAALVIPCFFPLYTFGMTMIIPLVPLLIYCMYKVIYEDKNNPILLSIVIALLIQSHIISTFILAIISSIFLLVNFRKIKKTHLYSFILSVIIGLGLSSGFIMQYIEQVSSQDFFFSWKMKDFPVRDKMLFDLTHNYNSGFTAITNYYDLPLKLLGLYYLLNFKKLKTLSKALLITSLIMYLSMTSLLPWHILKHTLIGSIQYTERLSFFLPVLMIIIFVNESTKSIIKPISIGILLMYFIGIVQSDRFQKSEPVNHFLNSNYNIMKSVYRNPRSIFINPVGDEYYNIDVNNKRIRDSKFVHMISDNVNIKAQIYSYNKAVIKYDVKKKSRPAYIVLPKIWYKGYKAEYSNGASGTQPQQYKTLKTKQEISHSKSILKPYNPYKVNYDGKIYLRVRNSGTVTVSYKKTKIQIIGYILESLSWITILVFSSVRYFKHFPKLFQHFFKSCNRKKY